MKSVETSIKNRIFNSIYVFIVAAFFFLFSAFGGSNVDAAVTLKSNNTSYSTIAAAIAASEDGDTITFTSNMSENVVIDAPINLSFVISSSYKWSNNGSTNTTLTINAGAYATVTISGGGLIAGNYECIDNGVNNKLVLKNITVAGNAYDAISNSGELIASSVTLNKHSTYCAGGICGAGGIYNSSTGTVEATNVYIYSNMNAGISNDGTVNFYSGRIEGLQTGAYNSGYMSLGEYGGLVSVVAGELAMNNSGTLLVGTNCTFTSDTSFDSDGIGGSGSVTIDGGYVAGEPVVTHDGEVFASISGALSHVELHSTQSEAIILQGNLRECGVLLDFNPGSGITIDLNGYSWGCTDGTFAIQINNANADLIITDSSSEKTGRIFGGIQTIYVNAGNLELEYITLTTAVDGPLMSIYGTSAYVLLLNANIVGRGYSPIDMTNGTLEIRGNTYIADLFGNTEGTIHSSGGTVSIYGGTIYGETTAIQNTGAILAIDQTDSINDIKIIGKTTSVYNVGGFSFYGGSLYGNYYSNSDIVTTGDIVSDTAIYDGYVYTRYYIYDPTLRVEYNDSGDVVYEMTLKDAISNAIGEGETSVEIRFLKNVNECLVIVDYIEPTIDLDGYTWSCSELGSTATAILNIHSTSGAMVSLIDGSTAQTGKITSSSSQTGNIIDNGAWLSVSTKVESAGNNTAVNNKENAEMWIYSGASISLLGTRGQPTIINYGALYMRGGEVTSASGEAIGQDGLNSSMYITGGTVYSSQSVAITIGLGSLTVGVSPTTASDIKIIGNTYAISGSFEFNDGTLYGSTTYEHVYDSTATIPDNYQVNTDTTATYNSVTYRVNYLQLEATVRLSNTSGAETYYSTFAEAFEALEEDGDDYYTIYLIADITESFVYYGAKKIGIIDLNGHTWNSGSSVAIEISFTNSGHIKITDSSSGNGRITSANDLHTVAFGSIGTLTIMGGTITNTFSSGTYVVENGGNLEITGGTITSSNSITPVYNWETGTVTMNGGTVTNTGSGNTIGNDGGTVTLIKGTVTSASGQTIVNSGTLVVGNSSTATTANTLVVRSTGNSAIKNTGTLSVGTTSTNVDAVKVIGKNASGYYAVVNTGTFNFNGGSLYGYSAYNNVYSGTITIPTGKVFTIGTATYSGTSYRRNYLQAAVAKIGTAYFATLQSAVNALTSTSTTIELLTNIDTSSSVTVSNAVKGIINISTYYWGNEINTNPLLQITNTSADITITGTTGSMYNTYGGSTIANAGTLTINGGTITGILAISNTGTVNMNNGTVKTANESAVVLNMGTFIMSGGTIEGTSTSATGYLVENSNIFTMSGGAITAKTQNAIGDECGTITITGGVVYSASNIAIASTSSVVIGTTSTAVNDVKIIGSTYAVSGILTFNGGSLYGSSSYTNVYRGTITVPSGKVVVGDTTTYNSTAYRRNYLVSGVAKIGTTYYATLQDAVDSLTSTSKTIDLLANISEDISIDAAVKGIINLNNWTWSSDTVTLTVSNSSASITIKDTSSSAGGKITSSGTIATIGVVSGTLDIYSEIDNTALANVIYVDVDGTLNIYDGAVINSTASASEASPVIENYGILTISGGEINASNAYAIENSGTATISGGDFDDTIYNCSNGEIKMSGGTITVTAGISILNEGTFEMNGGSITSTGSANAINSTSGTVTISKGTITSATGAAISNAGTLVVGNSSTATTENTLVVRSTGNVGISNSGTLTVGTTSTNVNAVKVIGSTYAVSGNFTFNGGSLLGNSTYTNVYSGTITLPSTKAIARDTVTYSSTPYKRNYLTNGVAKIGTTYYSTLQEAVNALTSTSKTIDLLANISESVSTSSTSAKGTINLNNFTWDSGTQKAFATMASSITITDTSTSGGGIITSSNSLVTIQIADGTLIITKGTFKNTSSTTGSVFGVGGTLRINGGTIQTTGTTSGGATIDNDGNLYITAGTVIGGVNTAIDNSGTVSITGGTITTTGSNNAIKSTSGTVTISKGTITSATGAAISNAGTLVVGNSSTATTENTLVVRSTGNVGISNSGTLTVGTTSTNVNAVKVIGSTYAVSGNFTFNGGSLLGNSRYTNVYSGTITIPSTKAIFIDTATYSSTTYKRNYLGAGVARIGTTYYSTLKEAVNALTSTSKTIELLTNVTECITISNAVKGTISLGNYTWSCGSSSATTLDITSTSAEITVSAGTGKMTHSVGGVITNRGKLTLSGVDVYSNSGTTITNSGTLSLTAETYVNYTGGSQYGALGIENNSGGTVTITESAVYSNMANAVTNGGTLTLNAGAIVGLQYGVSNVGTLNISNSYAEVSGEIAAILSDSGEVNITAASSITCSVSPCSDSGAAIIINSGTLEISGGNILGGSSSALSLNYQTIVTISGGTISGGGANGTIYTDSESLTISGGTITATGSYSAIVTDGYSLSTIVAGSITSANGVAINNSGGLIIGTSSTPTTANALVVTSTGNSAISNSNGLTIGTTSTAIDAVKITGKNAANYYAVVNTGTFNFNGGSLFGYSSYIYVYSGSINIPSGKSVISDKVGSYTRNYLGTAVAKITYSGATTYYASLANAVNALGTTSKQIDLLANISESITISSAVKGVINLNSYTWNSAGNIAALTIDSTSADITINGTGSITSSAPTATIHSIGTLKVYGTIVNTNGGYGIYNDVGGNLYIYSGASISTSSGTSAYAAVGNYATATMSGGTILGSNSIALDNTGTFEITGGVIYSSDNTAVSNKSSSTLTVGTTSTGVDAVKIIGKNAANYYAVSNSGTFNFNGGSLYGYSSYTNVYNGTITIPNTKAIFKDTATYSGTTYRRNYLGAGVAKIGTTYYSTLQEAVNALTSTSKTIDLLANISESVTISDSSDKGTINLNNFTWDSGSSVALTTSATSITITDSSTSAGGVITSASTIATIVIAEEAGNLIITKGTFKNTSTTTHCVFGVGATLIINGGTIQTTGNTFGNATIDNNGTLQITAGTINGGVATAINSTGSTTISGGVISSTGNITITNAGTLNITGGTISASGTYNAIKSTAGTVTISKGTITSATGAAISNAGTLVVGNSSTATTENTLVVRSTGNVGISNSGTLTVGTTSTNVNAVKVIGSTYAVSGNFTFNGGSLLGNSTYTNVYSGTITLPSGQAIFRDTATYSSTTYKRNYLGAGVARIGTTYYATLQEAVNALTSTSKTIELLTNVTECITISNAVKGTISLGNYTWSCGSSSATLNITSTSAEITVSAGTGKMTHSVGGVITNSGKLTLSGVDVYSNSGTTITNSGTLSLTAETFVNILNGNQYGALGIQNNSGGTVTITESAVYSNMTNAVTNAGTLTLNAGAIVGLQYGVVNNGGTLNISNSGSEVSGEIAAIQNNASGEVNITAASSITCSVSPCSESGAAIVNKGTLKISGGTINGQGSNAINNEDSGTVNISGGTINSKVYNTDSGTVNMTNGTINGLIENESKLNISGGNVDTTSLSVSAISNAVNGVATITGGTIKAKNAATIVNSKTLIINGGTVQNTGSYYAINNSSSSTIGNASIVRNIVIVASGNRAIYNTGTLTVGYLDSNNLSNPDKDTIKIIGSTDAVYVGSSATFTFNGGSLYAGSYDADTFNAFSGTINTPANYGLVADTATYNNTTYRRNYLQTAVASITYNNVTSYYSSITRALSDLSSNVTKTIKLLMNVTESVNISDSYSALGIIDLNSKTWTGSSYALQISSSNVSISITDNSTSAAGVITSSNSAGTIIINNGSFDISKGIIRNTATTTKPAISVASGTALIKGGTVEVTGTTIGDATISSGGTVVVSGGTVKGNVSTAVTNSGTLTIETGTISTTGTNPAVTNTGTVKMSGGSISSITQSIYNEGTVQVTGGTIHSTGDMAIESQSGIVTIGSSNIANDKITIKGYKWAVSMLDGTFNYESGTLYGEYNYSYFVGEDATLSRRGSEWTVIESGYYKTIIVTGVASVGGTTYDTLGEALNDANGGSITLLKSITELPFTLSANLDLNGNTLNNYVRNRQLDISTAYNFITVTHSVQIDGIGSFEGSKIFAFSSAVTAVRVNQNISLSLYDVSIESYGIGIYVTSGAELKLDTSLSEVSVTPVSFARNGYAIEAQERAIIKLNAGALRSSEEDVFSIDDLDLYVKDGRHIKYSEQVISGVTYYRAVITKNIDTDSEDDSIDFENTYTYTTEVNQSADTPEYIVIITNTRELTGTIELIQEDGKEITCTASSDKKTFTCTTNLSDFFATSTHLYNTLYEEDLILKYTTSSSMDIIRDDLIADFKVTRVANPNGGVIYATNSNYQLVSDGQLVVVNYFTSSEVDITGTLAFYKAIFGDQFTTIVSNYSTVSTSKFASTSPSGCSGNGAVCYTYYEEPVSASGAVIKTGMPTPSKFTMPVVYYSYVPYLNSSSQTTSLSNTCEYGEECHIDELSFLDYMGNEVENVETIVTLNGEVVDSIDTTVIGTYVVTTVATDSMGYKSKEVVREYTVVDNEAPVINYESDKIVIEKGHTYSDKDIIGMDNVDSDVIVERISNVNFNKAGEYIVQYRAIDSNGNETIISRTVVVEEKTDVFKWVVIAIVGVCLALGSAYLFKKRKVYNL